MISQIFNQDCFKLLSLFNLSPGSKFNRTEIKEKTQLNNVPLDKALSNLASSGIIKREKNYYFLNLDNEYTRKILEITSKQYKQLKELPLAVFYLLVDMVSSFSLFKETEVFLFGSYAKLIHKENSDVDIAFIYQKEPDKKKITKTINKLERNYNKTVEIHYFEKKSFYRNKKDLLVQDILKNGVKLI